MMLPLWAWKTIITHQGFPSISVQTLLLCSGKMKILPWLWFSPVFIFYCWAVGTRLTLTLFHSSTCLRIYFRDDWKTFPSWKDFSLLKHFSCITWKERTCLKIIGVMSKFLTFIGAQMSDKGWSLVGVRKTTIYDFTCS